MNPASAILRVDAARLGAVVAELHDCEDQAPLLQALVEQLAGGLDRDVPLDAAGLSAAGFDAGLAAKVLRSILCEAIEALRGALDVTDFSAAVLRMRACVRPAIAHAPVHEEDAEFYRRLLACDCEGIAPDHRRLMHLFEDLVLTFPDIVYVHDLNGTLLYVNMPGLKLTKFTAQDLREGISVYDLIVPEYAEMIETRIESPDAVSRAPYACEIYTKDGERIPFELTTRCIKRNGRVTGVIGLARDLRLARRLESEIRRSNAYIETIVVNAPIGIVLADSQTIILDANLSAVTLFGAGNANVLTGNPFYGLFEGDVTALRDALFGVLAQATETRVNWVHATAFETEMNCDLTIVPLRHEGGCVDSLLILMTDLRDQAALQQNLVQSEKLSAIGEIVAGVAHELNNPLTGILGYAQLLLGAKVDPSIRSRLEHIAAEAERCRRIVQNLLSFARHYDSEKTIQNVNDILTETLQLREYQLRIDGIALDIQLDPDLPNVVADAHELQRVFLNVINNAQQALGTVEGRQKRLAISTFVQDQYVNVRFADNGPGIPQPIQTKVFDPFFTTKGVGEGTGLGLSVSYGVIKDHGGHILLDSREGEGATFTIQLPLPESTAGTNGP